MGCELQVGRGELLCREHRRSEWGREVAAAFREVMGHAVEAAKDGGRQREKAQELFRRRVSRGDYGGLFDKPVRKILGQGATEKSLDQELGVLRMMMARLVLEDDDPVRQALGLSRVRAAAARVLEQSSMVVQTDTLQDWIHKVLTELDAADREGREPDTQELKDVVRSKMGELGE